MRDDLLKHELESFRNLALDVLKHVSAEREKLSSEPVPEIMLLMGSFTGDALREMLNSLSPATVVLYLCPESLNNTVSIPEDRKNLMILPVSSGSFSADKCGLFVALSKFRKVSFHVDSAFENAFSNELKAVNEAIRKAISNIFQSSSGRLVYLRNSIKNLPFILRDSEMKVDARGTELAIVCSAGPSLLMHIEFLKSCSEKFVIISVGRAAKVLSEHGIVPDFIVDVDPDVNWFDDGKYYGSIPVLSASARPDKTFENVSAMWISGDSFSFNRYIESAGVKLLSLILSKTVTVTALDLAVNLGCKKIAMTGSDLCLGESGNYYSDSGIASEGNIFLETDGADGGKVFTTANLNMLRNSIEDYISSSSLNHPCVSFFNCTARGAIIKGTVRMKMEDFLSAVKSLTEKKISRTEKSGSAEKNIDIDCLASLSEKLSELLSLMSALCFKIIRELRNSSVSDKKIIGLRQCFAAYCDRENIIINNPSFSWISNPVYEQAEDFTSEKMRHENKSDPMYQLLFLKHKYEFASAMFSDIMADLKQVSSKAFTQNFYEREFLSFKENALAFIRRENSEFADFISARVLPNETEFSFMPNLQTSSIINIIDRNQKYPLQSSEVLVMHEELELFLKENNFSEDKDVVIFFAPGNWVHVMAMAEKHYNARFAAIEIWPSVFSKVIASNMFFHTMPEAFSVFCIHGALKLQKNLLTRFIGDMKKERRRLLLFKNPYSFNVPGVDSAFKQFITDFGL